MLLVTWGTAIALVLEEILIVGQVLRGTTSHFNFSTPLNAVIWSAMGASILIVWLLSLLTAVLLLVQHLPNPALA